MYRGTETQAMQWLLITEAGTRAPACWPLYHAMADMHSHCTIPWHDTDTLALLPLVKRQVEDGHAMADMHSHRMIPGHDTCSGYTHRRQGGGVGVVGAGGLPSRGKPILYIYIYIYIYIY